MSTIRAELEWHRVIKRGNVETPNKIKMSSKKILGADSKNRGLIHYRNLAATFPSDEKIDEDSTKHS